MRDTLGREVPGPFWVALAQELGYTGGRVVCGKCGHPKAAMTEDLAAEWLRYGWPECCGERVKWERGVRR